MKSEYDYIMQGLQEALYFSKNGNFTKFFYNNVISEIKKQIRELHLQPQDLFEVEQLEYWAENNYYIKDDDDLK